MRAGLPLVAALIAALAMPGRAAGQDRYQDATGATYALAALELSTVLALVSLGVYDATTDSALAPLGGIGLALLDLALVAIATGISAGVAAATGAPSEVPLVWHGAIGGAVAVGALSAGIAGALAGGPGGETAAGLVIGGVVGLVAGAAWTGISAGWLAHDPQRLGPAHLLTWAPLPLAAIAFLVTMAATEDLVASALLAGALAAASVVAAVAWSESLPDPAAPVAPAPLAIGWSGRF